LGVGLLTFLPCANSILSMMNLLAFAFAPCATWLINVGKISVLIVNHLSLVIRHSSYQIYFSNSLEHLDSFALEPSALCLLLYIHNSLQKCPLIGNLFNNLSRRFSRTMTRLSFNAN